MNDVTLEQVLAILNAKNHIKKAIPFEIEFANFKGEISHKKRVILARNADKLVAQIAKKTSDHVPDLTQKHKDKTQKSSFLSIAIDLDTHAMFNFYLFAIIKINGKKLKL